MNFLIHEADPQSRPVVIIVFAHVVRPSVRRPPLFNTKQISSEIKVRYWRDCGSGWVDHWRHMSCLVSIYLRFLLLLIGIWFFLSSLTSAHSPPIFVLRCLFSRISHSGLPSIKKVGIFQKYKMYHLLLNFLKYGLNSILWKDSRKFKFVTLSTHITSFALRYLLPLLPAFHEHNGPSSI